MNVEAQIASLKTDVKWLKALLLAVIAVQFSGVHLFDPTLLPWVHIP